LQPEGALLDQQVSPFFNFFRSSRKKVEQMVEQIDKSKLRAVGYIRVSSKDQVEGYSLDFQTEAIQDYCKNKYDLKKLYS
jgi:predicted site-specific integrase-resolvase